MPVIVTGAQYQELLGERRPGLAGVAIEDNVVMLLPGPFEVCVARARSAGARPLLATTGRGFRQPPPGMMPATGL